MVLGRLLSFRSFGPVLLPVIVLHVGMDGVRTIGAAVRTGDETDRPPDGETYTEQRA